MIKTMNESDIRKYAGLMKELGLTGIEITDENRSLRLECTVNAPARETLYTSPVADTAQTPDSGDFISVKSPMVGVFYSAPAENADPYVAVGDSVKKGSTLCIVEAMKLMNEIASEYDGVISEICVTNGQVVEYGTELFRIKKGN